MGKGQVLGVVDGVEISVISRPSVTKKGMDRLWVTMRQTGRSDDFWKIRSSLAYVNGADVLFERRPRSDAAVTEKTKTKKGA